MTVANESRPAICSNVLSKIPFSEYSSPTSRNLCSFFLMNFYIFIIVCSAFHFCGDSYEIFSDMSTRMWWHMYLTMYCCHMQHNSVYKIIRLLSPHSFYISGFCCKTIDLKIAWAVHSYWWNQIVTFSENVRLMDTNIAYLYIW